MPGGRFPRPRRKRAAIRVSVLRTGALRSSLNQGTARKASRPTVGSTEQRRLFAPDSAAALGSLQVGPNSRERTHILARVTHPLAHGTTKAPLYAANSNPTKNPAEAGLSA